MPLEAGGEGEGEGEGGLRELTPHTNLPTRPQGRGAKGSSRRKQHLKGKPKRPPPTEVARKFILEECWPPLELTSLGEDVDEQLARGRFLIPRETIEVGGGRRGVKRGDGSGRFVDSHDFSDRAL